MRPPLPFTKPAMPKTCSTCIHWKQLPAGARNDGPLGECRESSPTADFKWPRTRGTEYCSCYASTAPAEIAYATGAERAPQPAAPVAAEQLSLVADPAAPKPAETGKNPPADAHGRSRPRSAKATPTTEAPAPGATGRSGDE